MNSKIWSDFSAHPPLNVEAGRYRKGGGGAWAFLFLMRFIDPMIFDSNGIHGPHPGPQENMQIGGVRCAISQIWPKFREMLGEDPADIHL